MFSPMCRAAGTSDGLITAFATGVAGIVDAVEDIERASGSSKTAVSASHFVIKMKYNLQVSSIEY